MERFDRPIIYSAPMVRALLADAKTQTRRLPSTTWNKVAFETAKRNDARLWVREAWQAGASDDAPCVAYRADTDRRYLSWHGKDEFPYDLYPGNVWEKGYWIADVEADGPWSPSIHMPRWASRMTQHVTDVRFEPLQDLTEEDAIAEGVCHWVAENEGNGAPINPEFTRVIYGTCRNAFHRLWSELHGKPGRRWEDNPTVAVLMFSTERANIDGDHQ